RRSSIQRWRRLSRKRRLSWRHAGKTSGTAGDAGTISHDTEVSADAEEKEGETQWPTKRLEINNYLQRREQNQRWREGSRF
ncbi:hypothetical protein J6590_098579, partial [Homalodisca vitripennis]